MLPVKPETYTHLKPLKSMVTHRLSCFSYVFLLANSTCWPFIHFFLPANSTCWLISFSFLFFYWPTQHVGFFLLANSTCWPFTLQPDGSHRLLLLAFPHAREILLEVLAIDSDRKLGAVQFLEHVCIPRQNLINLVQPVPSWRPLAILFIFSSQWQHCLPNQISNLEILWLDLLVICTSNFSLVFLNLLQ